LFNDTPGWDLQDQLNVATGSHHWRLFIEDRRTMIWNTLDRLSALHDERRSELSSAQRSLLRAAEQLELITPDLCVDFIQNWRADDDRWQQVMPQRGLAVSESEAMDELELSNWISCGYGNGADSTGSWRPRIKRALGRWVSKPKPS
jgi:hypothetical protein